MTAAAERRCRRRPVALTPGALRPSDLLASFFLPGLAFLLAAAAAAVADAATTWPWWHWLALHLAFVGGVSQLVLGAGQFFAGAFLATDPPRRALVRVQLAAWNAGTLLVAAGVPSGSDAAVVAGGALLAAGLVAFAAGLRGLQRRSLQRIPWAVRWYQASALFLGVGVLLGVLMATNVVWTHGNLLGAHIALNLAGWFGTAIVGTLHTFFPSLTQTQLRFASLQRATFASWTLGVAVLAAGFGFGAGAVVIAGWAALLLAAALLAANLAASLRATAVPLGLPARLLATAQPLLLAALATALAGALDVHATAGPSGATRDALGVLLVPGWLGLTVAGSLLHLLAVLGRVRDLRRPLPPPRPVRDRVLVTIALLGVVVLAAARAELLAAPSQVGVAALLASYAVLGGLVLSRAARAMRGGVPRV